jgi:hypothetical protein
MGRKSVVYLEGSLYPSISLLQNGRENNMKTGYFESHIILPVIIKILL